MPTGLSEFDRVLAGGLLPGSATLLGGEPGTGKSTLLLQVLGSMASSGRRCLLVAAEEAAHQVLRRASRLGAAVPGVFVVEASDLTAVEAAVATLAPDVLVVDSVQALSDPEGASMAGSPAQVRACAERLVRLAKALGPALVMVGHVTKDGSLAGPRTLEHLVDTVLSFEGDRYSTLRVLRSLKHRYGPSGEAGLFEMGEAGLRGVMDPSSFFIGDRMAGTPGSAVAVLVEGNRPLLVEVQALVGRSSPLRRRYVTGLDPGRVGFLVAVLDRHARLPVGEQDLYVSVAGGAKAPEPAADLAACLAIASCLLRRPVPAGIAAIGEVGLGGEVRRVSAIAKRLAEAARLGFSQALLPAQGSGLAEDAALQRRAVRTLEEAVAAALGPYSVPGPRGTARRDRGGPLQAGRQPFWEPRQALEVG
jgi:DNA repair protein RadA/Sms